MKTIRLCSGCGNPLGADAPAALCPQCLLRSGIQTEIDESGGTATRIPVPGETFGHYRILRLLGEGGMGRVFEAEHDETGRRVALKVMGKALASEDDRKRFLREGRLAASVNHPNVVYIHGSEEIDGSPIIAMELARGGTLKDRIKQGPLPVAEAVGAALQLIDGLEAANAAGVLHRDIKPANCFVASDGTVKVGDFGLSVSTLARGESLLTASGAVMGTPTYASPEQLRGEELDVRSDIYSVGATLYHLLTGNRPFGATDFVKLITEVLDKEPPSPKTVRSEIPAELSRAVMRCLAKDRKARFQDYATLRDALLPFRSEASAAAKPAIRFVAAIVDDLTAYLPSMVFLAYWSYDPLDNLTQSRTLRAFLVWLACYGAYVLYYAVAEGRWGAGFGKNLCGLRVIDEQRNHPGLARAAIRALIYSAPITLPALVYMAFTSASEIRAAAQRDQTVVTDWIWLPLTVLLFVTMRARNGYAAIHDLASRTRVIVRPKTQTRPAGSPAAATGMISRADAPRAFGPYEVAGTLWKTAESELVLARDPALRRNVWIHVTPAFSPEAEERRDLSRPGRLRWLDSGKADGGCWTAYEAPGGAPLLAMAQQPQPWDSVRFWLLDLAEECDSAAGEPATAPVLSLDRIWITSSGRALLTEFPAPGLVTVAAEQGADARDSSATQAFLSKVARVSLSGSTEALPDGAPVKAPLPLQARQFLTRLGRGAFDELRYVVGNLQSLTGRPAEVTRPRRTATLVFVPAIALVFAALFAAVVISERARWDRVWKAFYPGEPSLRVAAELYVDNAPDSKVDGFDAADFALIGTYIAKRFAPVLTNEAFWTAQPTLSLVPNMRERVQEAVAQNSNADPAQAKEAERVLPRRMARFERAERLAFARIGAYIFAVFFAGAALIDLVAVLAFGITPVLRLFGISVVDRAGNRASRARMLWRWFAVWAPSIGAVCLITGLTQSLTTSEPWISFGMDLALLLAALGGLLAALIHTARHPAAGLHDRIAGTRLVPH